MKTVLRLYISGISAVSISALRNVRVILEKENANCSLEVIDVLKNPEVLEENNILSTPLLEKVEPKPTKRFLGENYENILAELDLKKEDTVEQ